MKKWKIHISAFLHSVALLILSYFLWNNPHTLDEEYTIFKFYYTVQRWLFPTQEVPEDVLLVNISYDRELVDTFDDFGIPTGKSDITDRYKLARFLQSAVKYDNYKYILLDINLNPIYKSDSDSLLYSIISTIERIVIPKHENQVPPANEIFDKAAYSDYYINYNEDKFLKYQYIHHDEESIPLRMYKEIDGKTIQKKGPFYFSEQSLCSNVVFLSFPLLIENDYNLSNEKLYLNLGVDIIDIEKFIDIEKIIDNKIIIIGDLKERDMHSTIAGQVPGPVITYNAYKELHSDKHKISYWILLSLLVLFFIISLTVFLQKDVSDFFSKVRLFRTSIVQFLLNWLGLTFVFGIYCLIVFLLSGRIVDVFIIAAYFSLLIVIINHKEEIKTWVKKYF